MKPIGRPGKFYSVNCPRPGRKICMDCYLYHKHYTKGKNKLVAKRQNRSIEKRNSLKIIKEYSYE